MPDEGRSLIEVTRLTTTGISVLTDAAPCLPPSSLIECRLTRGWHRSRDGEAHVEGEHDFPAGILHGLADGDHEADHVVA